MKQCIKCDEVKPLEEFPQRSDSKKPRPACRTCESKARLSRGYKTPSKQQQEVHNKRLNEWYKQMRRDPANAAKVIVKDSRNADGKKGLRDDNDLTVELVQELIKNGCTYCGDRSIRMTLDRIDNKLAHTLQNVVAACYRCNMIRGNMPYDAWLNIVPAIKDTFERGLFAVWDRFGPWGGVRSAEDLGVEPSQPV